VIDDSSNIIFSDGLRQADQLDLRNYNRVPLGRVEPGVMRDLVREKRFFVPEPVQIDFQGVCERLNYFVPVRNHLPVVNNIFLVKWSLFRVQVNATNCCVLL